MSDLTTSPSAHEAIPSSFTSSEIPRRNSLVLSSSPEAEEPPFTLPIGADGEEIPTAYIIEKLHEMGKDLFNNAQSASCVLRIVDSPKDDAFTTVNDKTDKFFWVHELFLISQSSLFRKLFEARPDDEDEADWELPAVKQGAINIAYRWHAIRPPSSTTETPAIFSYDSTNCHSRRSSVDSNASSPSETNAAAVYPLLSLHLSYPPIVPETLYWLYTGDDTRFMRALSADIRHKQEVQEVLDLLGVGSREKRRRDEECRRASASGRETKRAVKA